jgi:hypothetical protein
MAISVKVTKGRKLVATADFFVIPVKKKVDYSCSPPDGITFQEARSIAKELNEDKAQGTLGDRKWRRA